MGLFDRLSRGVLRPEARDDAYTLNENESTTVAPLQNDAANAPGYPYARAIVYVDQGDFLGTVEVVDNRAHLKIDPGSAYDYLGAGETATATIIYGMQNAFGYRDRAEITLTITGQNDDPNAQDVTGSASEDGPGVTVAAAFTDPDANDTHSLAFEGALGSVSDNGDGTFTYDPNGQFESLAEGETATDTFSYTVSDGNGGTSTATATVTITGENDDPVVQDLSGTVGEDQHDVSFSADFSDVDTNDVHSLIVDTTGLTGGSVTVLPNGTFYFSPRGDFQYLHAGETATETFTYTVEDNHGGSDTATVTVTIEGADDDATISGDNAGAVEEDGTLTDSGTLTVSDRDHDQSSYQTVAPAALAGAYGDFTFDEATGAWSYALRNGDANVNALTEGEQVFDTLTVTSLDGSANETITVTITGNNNAPTSSPVDLGVIDEDTPLLITQADLLVNAADTDGDVLTASGLQILTGNGTVIDNGDGTWSYTPALNDDSDVTFGYAISDGEEAIAAMASLDITPVNDAPVAVDDDFTDPDLGVTINNFADLYSYLGPGGEVDDPSVGVGYFAQTFTADAGGLDALTIRHTSFTGGDGPSKFRILITEFSEAGGQFHPTTVLYESAEQAAMSATNGVTRVDIGGLGLVEGQRYAIVVDYVVAFDGVEDHAALANSTNSDTIEGNFFFSRAVSGDRAADFDSFFHSYDRDMSLILEYGPPELTDEDTAVTIQASELLANDTDVEGDMLSIGSVSATSAMGAAVSIDAMGNVIYDPTGSAALQALGDGETATDTFTYTATDGTDTSAPATVTVSVTGVDDANLVIDFEDYPVSGRVAQIMGTYKGFDWGVDAYVSSDDPVYDGSGFETGRVSGSQAAYNGYSRTFLFTRDSDFDFVGGYFTGGWRDGLQVTVKAYDDGVLTATDIFTVDSTAPTYHAFEDAGFDSIDRVEITTAGGTVAGYEASGAIVVMDDLSFIV